MSQQTQALSSSTPEAATQPSGSKPAETPPQDGSLLIWSEEYEALPLAFDVSSAEALTRSVAEWHLILSRCAAHESMFSDYARGCSGLCDGLCRDISPSCAKTKLTVTAAVAKPDALTWKVWRKQDGQYVDLVGILRLERIVPGCDAVAHYFFWDKRLRDKEQLLEAWWEWATTGWLAVDLV